MCNSNKSSKPTLKSPLGQVFQVETIFEKPTVNLDLNGLDSADIATLKETDPFMYYSISEIRSALILHEELDITRFDIPTHRSEKKQKREGDQFARIVTRKSRHSFEAHPDLILESVMVQNDSIRTTPMLNSTNDDDFDYMSILEEVMK